MYEKKKMLMLNTPIDILLIQYSDFKNCPLRRKYIKNVYSRNKVWKFWTNLSIKFTTFYIKKIYIYKFTICYIKGTFTGINIQGVSLESVHMLITDWGQLGNSKDIYCIGLTPFLTEVVFNQFWLSFLNRNFRTTQKIFIIFGKSNLFKVSNRS